MLRCILGQLQPSSGEIRLRPETSSEGSRCSPLISWVPQRVTLYPLLSVAQNLAGFARIMGVPRHDIASRVAEVLALIGLEHRAGDMAKTLSGGMQRMLNIGIGLVSNPRILLLDEPTVGIDRSAHERLYVVLDQLKEQGLGILLTTHDLDDVARLASRAVILVNGQMRAEGDIDELIHRHVPEQREVRLQLVSGSMERSLVEQELTALGLTPIDEEFWGGLIDPHGGQLERLYRQLDTHGDVIGDFSLNRPGLDVFIKSLSHGGRPGT